jgi:hypothetical protein
MTTSIINDDGEMWDAMVSGLARQILRSRLHTKKPPWSKDKILAEAQSWFRTAALDGYTFGNAPEQLAADATGKADYRQDTDVNWDQWAFGH